MQLVSRQLRQEKIALYKQRPKKDMIFSSKMIFCVKAFYEEVKQAKAERNWKASTRQQKLQKLREKYNELKRTKKNIARCSF